MTTLQIANGYLELHKQEQRHDSPTEGTFLQSERENILCKIRGQTVRIPNLSSLMAGWPADVNPYRETIKTVIDDILERCVPDPRFTVHVFSSFAFPILHTHVRSPL